MEITKMLLPSYVSCFAGLWYWFDQLDMFSSFFLCIIEGLCQESVSGPSATFGILLTVYRLQEFVKVTLENFTNKIDPGCDRALGVLFVCFL